MPDRRDRDNELIEARANAVLGERVEDHETRSSKIEGRIEDWDKLLIRYLLKFAGRMVFLISIGGLMGGNMATVKETIIAWLRKWHE